MNARLNGRLNACHGVAGVAGVARRNASSALQGHVSHLASVSETQDADLRALRARIAAKREDLTRRRARLDYVRRRDDTHDDDDNDDDGNRAPRLRQSISHLAPRIHNRRAHLLDTLAFIYPIALVSAQDLLFSICGRALPNSPAAAIAEHAADEEDVAAALGYTAQLVALLSAYLETSLHYEIATAGSRSVIRDGISMMNGPRGCVEAKEADKVDSIAIADLPCPLILQIPALLKGSGNVPLRICGISADKEYRAGEAASGENARRRRCDVCSKFLEPSADHPCLHLCHALPCADHISLSPNPSTRPHSDHPCLFLSLFSIPSLARRRS